jgi:hypothetical protein
MRDVFDSDIRDVPVVRKHHDLIAACEIGEGFEHHPRAVIVRCHECILQNDRHVDTGGTPNIKRRQPKCKVELIKRAFAHCFDANPSSAAALCEQDGFFSRVIAMEANKFA